MSPAGRKSIPLLSNSLFSNSSQGHFTKLVYAKFGVQGGGGEANRVNCGELENREYDITAKLAYFAKSFLVNL